jgi:hypothetical protein
MNESEKQFSFTRAALSTGGRAKSKFLSVTGGRAKSKFLSVVRDAAEGDDGPVLKFKRRNDVQLLHRLRQVADDEAASRFPERLLSDRCKRRAGVLP